MSKKFCPSCNEEITYLNYSRTNYQNGEYDIENDDYIIDYNSRDIDDDVVTYACPSCSAETIPEDLLNEQIEEDKT